MLEINRLKTARGSMQTIKLQLKIPTYRILKNLYSLKYHLHLSMTQRSKMCCGNKCFIIDLYTFFYKNIKLPESLKMF